MGKIVYIGVMVVGLLNIISEVIRWRKKQARTLGYISCKAIATILLVASCILYFGW